MPVLKKPLKEPEPHEHLDGDFGLDDLAALRAHFKTGHLKSPFPGDSWKILTRKHMKFHGFTPVDGAPASAEVLNQQIAAEHLPEPLFPSPEPGYVTSGTITGSQIGTGKVTADEAKAAWLYMHDTNGAIPSASEFEAELTPQAYAEGGLVPSQPVWPEFATSGDWQFIQDTPGGPGHWAHTQQAKGGWVTYHHQPKKHLWPALPEPKPEPEWSTTVWVSHSDITNLEQAAVARVAAAVKKSAHLKVIKGYQVIVLPEPGTMAAANAADEIKKAIAKGHTIAAHISVGWYPPAKKGIGGAATAGMSSTDWAEVGQDLFDAAKALGVFTSGMTIKDMAEALSDYATAKSKNGAAHPGCAFADHKDYKAVKDSLVMAAKILGIDAPGTFSLTALAAAIAVQVKAMDSQLDAVLAQLGIKPPDGAPAVSGGGVNSGKLIPESLAPKPPADGTGTTEHLNWSKAHALLKFAGQLTHDEATNALGTAALHKPGYHSGGVHVCSPDPNSYTVWFDPEPGDKEFVDPGDQVSKGSAVVVSKVKAGKPQFMPEKGKYYYPPGMVLMGDLGTETVSHLAGGECHNEHQAGQKLTTGPAFFSHGDAAAILAMAKKHYGHPLKVPAEAPVVTVVFNAPMGKYCMAFGAPAGLTEYQAIDALVKSGWYDKNQALIVVLQAKNNSEHEVKAPFVKVGFSVVTGLWTVEVKGSPAKSPLVPSPEQQQAMDAAEAELAKQDMLKQLGGQPEPPSFDELLGELGKPPAKGVFSYDKALLALEETYGLEKETAEHLLTEAKAAKGLWVAPAKQSAKVKWHAAGKHYHIEPDMP